MYGPKYKDPSFCLVLVINTFGYLSFLVILIKGYDFPSISFMLYLGLYFLINFSSRRNDSISEETPITFILLIWDTRILVFSPKSFEEKYEATLFFKFSAFPT